MFVQLFETHPDVQDNFADFRGQTIESLKGSIGEWCKKFAVFDSCTSSIVKLKMALWLELTKTGRDKEDVKRGEE